MNYTFDYTVAYKHLTYHNAKNKVKGKDRLDAYLNAREIAKRRFLKIYPSLINKELEITIEFK